MQMSGSGFFQFSNVGFIFLSLVFFSQFHSIKLNILSLKIGLNFIPLNLSIATRLTFFKKFLLHRENGDFSTLTKEYILQKLLVEMIRPVTNQVICAG